MLSGNFYAIGDQRSHVRLVISRCQTLRRNAKPVPRGSWLGQRWIRGVGVFLYR
jgi:hypothetical protein